MIAALAILHTKESLRKSRFALYQSSDCQPVIDANRFLSRIGDRSAVLGMAIAILENLQSSEEDIDPPSIAIE